MDIDTLLQALIQLQQSGQKIPQRDEILEYLNPINIQKLKKVQNQLRRIQTLTFSATKHRRVYKTKKQFDGRKGYLQGLLFERMIQVVFEDSQIFELQPRVQTAACEIDFFIHVLPPYNQLFPTIGSHQRIFGEAKCHAVGAKSEWVNTHVGKMTGNGTRLGMLFTFHKPGCAPSEFRTAVKDHFRSQPPTEIIPWGPSLVDELVKGVPFLRLVIKQHNLAYMGTTALIL